MIHIKHSSQIKVFINIHQYYKNLHRFEFFLKELRLEEREIISKNISFYNKLSLKNKKYFEHRIIKFMDSHNFKSREGFIITDEIKLLIAATAIKVSFGYRNYLFSIIDTIIVYPKDYFSNLSNQQHKGEINPKYKAVVFSWKDFEEGLKIENDNLNLGLHEFTHAMQFSFKINKNSESRYFNRKFNNLLNFLEDKKVQKKLLDSGYLREYAFENQYEFLAVLVEHYFETPIEFKEKLPEIFNHTKRILNIDIEN